MKDGFKIPDVTFHTRVRDHMIGGDNPFIWRHITTEELFKDRRVVLFSLPGAFTPTCSTMQVPGFENRYDTIKALGVDEVYVISVNDTFVMRKWMIDQKVEKIKFIPDGNGDFTAKMGMLVDKFNLGFGQRSWRYAAVIENMEVEKWFEEPGREDDCPTDPYGETSAENIIKYLEIAAEYR